jgi:hypothetical protein
MEACSDSGSITCDRGHIKLAMENLELGKQMVIVFSMAITVHE